MVQPYVTNPAFLAPTFVFLNPNLATSIFWWFLPDLAFLFAEVESQEKKLPVARRIRIWQHHGSYGHPEVTTASWQSRNFSFRANSWAPGSPGCFSRCLRPMAPWSSYAYVDVPGLVNITITMERSTIFHGKTHYFDWAMFKFANCLFTRPGTWGNPKMGIQR